MTMRTFRLLPLLFILSACSGNERAPAPVTPPSATEPEAVPMAQDTAVAPTADTGTVQLHSLVGSGLKFHGVYDSPTSGNLHYFMRFFERGNVALVAGRQEPNDPHNLASLLTEDVKSGTNNVHNVPVTVRGDSLYFATMATRGAITYAGVVEGDSLHFLKHSKVTGKKAVVSYVFVPDSQ